VEWLQAAHLETAYSLLQWRLDTKEQT